MAGKRKYEIEVPPEIKHRRAIRPSDGVSRRLMQYEVRYEIARSVPTAPRYTYDLQPLCGSRSTTIRNIQRLMNN